mgnify:CR=1 FL=1
MNYSFITIEGNIGAGKTTLATAVSKLLDAHLILEEFAENPFLPKFYEQPDKHAFALEMSFMAARFQQLSAIQTGQNLFNPYTISDYVFFKSLIFASVTLSEDEATLYKSLFNIIQSNLPQPEILIYLYSPSDVLLENIKKRGRPYEQNIRADYLEKINQTYFDFFKQINDYPILIVDTTKHAFLSPEFILEILEKSYPKGLNFIET